MSGAHEIGLSVSWGNKRYFDAWKGLDALADTLGRNVDDLGHVVAREMRTFINSELGKLAKRHSGPATTNAALATRSGRLVRELQRGGVVHDGPKIEDVYGKITLPGEYRVHEYGGTIRPREGQYIFVPLPAALKSDGTPKKLNPRQWQNTFIAESRQGNLLLFRRSGRRLAKLSDPSGVRIAGAPIVHQTLADTLVTGTAVSELDRLKSAGFGMMWSSQVSERGARDGTDKGASSVYFGAGANNAYVPTWGSPELLVDPYSESKTGKVALTMFAFVDVLIQRTATHYFKLTGVQDRA